VTFNLGIGLGGVTGGLIATTSNDTSFTVLFLVDAATFLAFVAALAFVPTPPRADEAEGELEGRYRDVFRNRVFLAVIALNAVFVAGGYAQFELLPVFAKNHAAVTERGIGLIFFVNTSAIVVAQLPVAKLLEGRSRMKAYAALGAVWATAWLLAVTGGEWFSASSAVAVLALAALVFGLGECIHGAVQAPLVVDLAPRSVRGRYMALSATSWSVGFVVGPALGGFALAASPFALWPVAAAVCLAAGAASRALEPRIPLHARATPA
jgi:predicted MFS family arabinose efflux permease